MSTIASRKASFKQPPADRGHSQQVRRNKALEEQKYRRAKLVESERHVDLFAHLNLGDSDEECATEDTVVREGIGHLAPFLSASTPATSSSSQVFLTDVSVQDEGRKRSNRPNKSRSKQRKGKAQKASPWADKCMYAELLEMQDLRSFRSDGVKAGILSTGEGDDSLPEDLEDSWVAVAPVPKGKRCLAIAHQGSGTVGLVPNTTLRSRVLGRPLMPKFPSPLPSDTILDCILDANWKHTGIVHVLDTIKWKGQDMAQCEASFRFWWRDTRLSELPPPQLPTHTVPPTPSSSAQASHSSFQLPASPYNDVYQFPYPTTFIPIPYHSSTTCEAFMTTIIPAARQTLSIPMSVPSSISMQEQGGDMDIDNGAPITKIVSRNATIVSDGLLLYVAQGLYESGTSPLSCWVPIEGYEDEKGHAQPHWLADSMQIGRNMRDRPLDLFEELVRRRVMMQRIGVTKDMVF